MAPNINLNKAVAVSSENVDNDDEHFKEEIEEDISQFEAMFDEFANDCIEICREDCGGQEEVVQWMNQICKYNVPNGKKFRAHMLLAVYRHYAEPESLTPENLRLVRIMGWLGELMQACALMID